MTNYCEKTGKECSGTCGCGGYSEAPNGKTESYEGNSSPQLKKQLEQRLLTEGRDKARRYAEMLRYRK